MRSYPWLVVWAALVCGCGDNNSGMGSDASSGADGGSQQALRVLFIGNSYTYVNDLPEQVRSLVASASPPRDITVDSVTTGGATLYTLYETGDALAKLRTGGWTHVVIQGQSLEPVGSIQNPAAFEQYAKLFGEEAKAIGAVPVYYETWARRADDDWYRPTMQAELRDSYRQAAWGVGGVVAAAGDAWELALSDSTPFDLFMADGSHPNTLGTYLTACVFYNALVQQSAVGLGAIPSDVTASDAARLQAIADRACQGNACGPTKILTGTTLLSSSESCMVDGCLYMPETCTVTLTTAGEPQLYAGPSTFSATCGLTSIATSATPGAIFTPVGCHDLQPNTATWAGTVTSGAGSHFIRGGGLMWGEDRSGGQRSYGVSFTGAVNPQQTQSTGTLSITLADDLCQLSGPITLQ